MSFLPAATQRVWGLAWPIILSNITVPLLGLVDTAVVGHLSDARYLAAVTLGATLFSFLFWGFGFLRMGTTGLTSQAHGRGDTKSLRHLLGQSLIIALILGLILIALSPLLITAGLDLLGGAPDTRELANGYAYIRICSAPAVLVNYALIGWFLGQQNSRVTLLIMVLTNSINIVLDLILVVGLDMTSNGVALASVVADYCACATGLWLAMRQLKRIPGTWSIELLSRLRAYAPLFHVNRHLFVRTMCLLSAMAFFTAQGARIDTTTLAANAILMQLVMMTSYGLDGFASAAEALVGEAAGKNDKTLMSHHIVACTWFSILTATGAALLFWLAGPWFISLMTGLAPVTATAVSFLPWLVVMPLVAVWSYLLDGVFIGLTDTRAMRDTMIIALMAYMACWYVTQSLANTGLWLSFTLFTAVRSLGLGAIYLKRHT
ncbi:MATE family efflux transporter [Larsenimonas rhizosphaerae]|uniref:MATE family efflux transporter n=1 Tax=Larsenimonas rhizosphaerae TaxID=2944682 RepID=A0AA41ZPQ3_9GAMM|nr:MATE family efflux transporter [Larsenimonas rhizosphaerae]MCX2524955.1 MATE family efflux transporter [Larsenimonas rhizosphaerae]